MKRILSILLVLMLSLGLIVPAAALAEEMLLPDMSAFAGDVLTAGEVTDYGYCIQHTYTGNAENIVDVVVDYMNLVEKKYGYTIIDSFTTTVDDSYPRHDIAFNVPNAPEGFSSFTMSDSSSDYSIDDCHLFISYSYLDGTDENFLQITYSSDFTRIDTGDRLGGNYVSIVAPKPVAASTPEPTLEPTPAPTSTPTPKPTATPKKYQAPIVGNDGLLVMSPEEYNDDIDACDSIGQQGNYYRYRYQNRGKEYSGDGDDMEWAKFETYVDALEDSGYYKVIANYDGEAGNTESWYLEYTGPSFVKKTFKVNNKHTERAAIVVQSFHGDVYVFYSLDVITNDIEETQSRLGQNIFASNSSGGSSSRQCDSCHGSGDCTFCGGSGKDDNLVAGTTTWLSQNCLYCGGSGDCTYCGGDGER